MEPRDQYKAETGEKAFAYPEDVNGYSGPDYATHNYVEWLEAKYKESVHPDDLLPKPKTASEQIIEISKAFKECYNTKLEIRIIPDGT